MRRIMNIGAHTHTLSDTAYKCDPQDDAGVPHFII